MVYQGESLSGEHSIQVTVDGVLALVAKGRERVEFLATRPGEDAPPPLQHRPEPDPVVLAQLCAPRQKRKTITWPNCDHTIEHNTPCPYCEHEQVGVPVIARDPQAQYNRGYTAGVQRLGHLQNKIKRMEEALQSIADGHSDPAATAAAALARETKPRRGRPALYESTV